MLGKWWQMNVIDYEHIAAVPLNMTSHANYIVIHHACHQQLIASAGAAGIGCSPWWIKDAFILASFVFEREAQVGTSMPYIVHQTDDGGGCVSVTEALALACESLDVNRPVRKPTPLDDHPLNALQSVVEVG